jgi:hypothetical protein
VRTFADTHDKTLSLISRYYARVDLGRDFESEQGSIPIGAIVETGTTWGVPAAGSLLFYFC